MKKESAPRPEGLDGYREFLRDLFDVMCFLNHHLSVGGMSWGRSPIGAVNELAIDVIKAIVKDTDFLYGSPDSNTSNDMEEKLARLGGVEIEEINVPEGDLSLLTRLTAAFEWVWQETFFDPRSGEPRYSLMIQGLTWLVKESLNKLVNQGEVRRRCDEIKDSPEKTKKFLLDLKFEVKDMRVPRDLGQD